MQIDMILQPIFGAHGLTNDARAVSLPRTCDSGKAVLRLANELCCMLGRLKLCAAPTLSVYSLHICACPLYVSPVGICF